MGAGLAAFDMTAQRCRSAALDRRHDLELAEAHVAWDARQAGPRRRKMSATSTAGRGNGRASAGHLQQEVERARHLADRADGDACVQGRRVELLVSQQPRAIMRTFYVTET